MFALVAVEEKNKVEMTHALLLALREEFILKNPRDSVRKRTFGNPDREHRQAFLVVSCQELLILLDDSLKERE